MSSYRKIQPRHIARERAQPSNRTSLGLLEKRKDYLKRYKRRKEREEYVGNLERQAALRNPEEFYFGMINVERKNNKLYKKTNENQEETNKIETDYDSKDLLYLKMKKAIEEKKISKIQSSLHFLRDLDSEELKQNIVYVDTVEEAANFDEEKYFDTPKPLLTRCYNLPRTDVIKKGLIVNEDILNIKQKEFIGMEKKRAEIYAELAARIDRRDKIQSAINSIELERHKKKDKQFYTIKNQDGIREYKWKYRRLK